MRIKRNLMVAATLCAMVVAGGAMSGAAFAVTVSLTPTSQSLGHTETAIYGGAWGDTGPYNVTFSYGDGSPSWSVRGTSATSHGWSHASPEPCQTTTYSQQLHVQDHSGGIADAYAHTTFGGGHPCI